MRSRNDANANADALVQLHMPAATRRAYEHYEIGLLQAPREAPGRPGWARPRRSPRPPPVEATDPEQEQERSRSRRGDV